MVLDRLHFRAEKDQRPECGVREAGDGKQKIRGVCQGLLQSQ